MFNAELDNRNLKDRIHSLEQQLAVASGKRSGYIVEIDESAKRMMTVEKRLSQLESITKPFAIQTASIGIQSEQLNLSDRGGKRDVENVHEENKHSSLENEFQRTVTAAASAAASAATFSLFQEALPLMRSVPSQSPFTLSSQLQQSYYNSPQLPTILSRASETNGLSNLFSRLPAQQQQLSISPNELFVACDIFSTLLGGNGFRR